MSHLKKVEIEPTRGRPGEFDLTLRNKNNWGWTYGEATREELLQLATAIFTHFKVETVAEAYDRGFLRGVEEGRASEHDGA